MARIMAIAAQLRIPADPQRCPRRCRNRRRVTNRSSDINNADEFHRHRRRRCADFTASVRSGCQFLLVCSRRRHRRGSGIWRHCRVQRYSLRKGRSLLDDDRAPRIRSQLCANVTWEKAAVVVRTKAVISVFIINIPLLRVERAPYPAPAVLLLWKNDKAQLAVDSLQMLQDIAVLAGFDLPKPAVVSLVGVRREEVRQRLGTAILRETAQVVVPGMGTIHGFGRYGPKRSGRSR